MLLPSVSDIALSVELSALAALSVSLIFVGSSNGDISSTILQTLMERDEAALKDPFAKFLSVSLGLLYLGKQEDADPIIETLKVIEHQISKQAQVFVSACAYAATGNVLKVQEMLHHCNEHLGEGVDDLHQAFAVVGIALIASGEEIGTQMALRSFNHLMHYGEPRYDSIRIWFLIGIVFDGQFHWLLLCYAFPTLSLQFSTLFQNIRTIMTRLWLVMP